MAPEEIVEQRIQRICDKYGLAPLAARAILGEFIEGLHETAFKGSSSDAFYGVYRSIGSEAGWHFWGLLYRNLEGSDGEYLSDSRGMWHETALRLDSRMKRFACILERWNEEKQFEEEEAKLEAEERDKKGT